MIERIMLWIQIRSLETMIDARQQLFPRIQDSLVRVNMEYLNDIAWNELRRLKRKYNES